MCNLSGRHIAWITPPVWAVRQLVAYSNILFFSAPSVLNKLIVLIAIAIPVLPVLLGEGRNEVARWYIAAAVNAETLDEGDPDALLARAIQWGDGSSISDDLWLQRIVVALKRNPESVPDLLSEAIEEVPTIAKLARSLGAELCEGGEFCKGGYFEAAVRTALLFPTSGELSDIRHLDQLNQVAYYRSLAGTELDQALQDIETALQHLPSQQEQARAAFLDTRAWVLHGLRRHEEALVDINKCFEILNRSQSGLIGLMTANADSGDDNSRDDDAEISATESDFDASEPNSKTAENANNEAKRATTKEQSLGPIYYHRAKILEALDRFDEAEMDFQWLRSRGLPVDGSLV